jgi:hypothetical protein
VERCDFEVKDGEIMALKDEVFDLVAGMYLSGFEFFRK